MNPFARNEADRIDSIGESELIERMKTWLGDASPPTPQGIGDDCSVLPLSPFENRLLVTADPVIYDKHFDERLEPEQVARKLLRRNASDIASMGGFPKSATLSLALPSKLSLAWLQRFYEGLAQEANRLQIQISGGDTSATSDFLGAFMTLIGVANERILERGKATLGSPIYVTGELGGSLLEKHYAFEPRLAEGQWLAEYPETLSCMDLSDGLGKDCPALLSPGLAARLYSKRIPISDAARLRSELSGLSALEHAVNDGEDYELLFALAPMADFEAFETRWRETFETPLSQIGIVIEGGADRAPLSFDDPDVTFEFTGYEYFRASE